jgi:hypothetical protein
VVCSLDLSLSHEDIEAAVPGMRPYGPRLRLGGAAALFVDLIADGLLLGLPGLGPFGGMVSSGKEFTRAPMAVVNSFSSLSRSSALIFDEAQTTTARAALARSRGGNISSAKAATILCIVAFTVEIMMASQLRQAHIIAYGALVSTCEEQSASVQI